MPDGEGVWLAYTFGWGKVVAFPDEFTAMSYVSEQGGRRWDVAFAPWGEWFGPGCIVVQGLVGGP